MFFRRPHALRSELELHDLDIANKEKAVIASNAIIAGGFCASSAVTTGISIATTPAAHVGTGFIVTGSVTSLALAWGGFAATVGITFLGTYVAYEELIAEANRLKHTIEKEEAIRKNNREALFFELLRIRSFYTSDQQFIEAFDQQEFKSLKSELATIIEEKQALPRFVQFINTEYQKITLLSITNPESKSIQAIPEFLTESHEQSTQSQLKRSAILQHLGVNQTLPLYFNPTPRPTVSLKKPLLVGCAAGFVMAGNLAGSVFSTLTLLVGFAGVASLMATGWGAVAIACVLVGFVVTVGVSRCKYKNMQREALHNNLENQNQTLENAQMHCGDIIQKNLNQKQKMANEKIQQQEQQITAMQKQSREKEERESLNRFHQFSRAPEMGAANDQKEERRGQVRGCFR